MARVFRGHLRAAGVDRPALFEHNETRQQIRFHDLRATMITIALSTGRSETWVADRTGHKSSTMINRYRRAARTASELRSRRPLAARLGHPRAAAERGRRTGSSD